jgi:hypothetical protein
MKTAPELIAQMFKSICGLRAERAQAEQGKRPRTDYVLDRLSDDALGDVESFIKSFRRWAEEGDND